MATPKRQRQALVANARRQRLEQPGVRAVRAEALKVRVAVIETLNRGATADPLIVGAWAKRSAEILGDGMAATHVGGLAEVLDQAAAAGAVPAEAARQAISGAGGLPTGARAVLGATEALPVGTEYEGAVRFTAQRVGLSAQQVGAIRANYGGPAAEAAAGLSRNLNAKLAPAFARIVEEGLDRRKSNAVIRRAFRVAGVVPRSDALVETLFRTNTQIAFSAGQWEVDTSTAMADVLWGYEYVTIGDDRVRAAHVALDGTKLPKEAPEWNTIFPPNGWNCRCQAIRIYREVKEKPPRTKVVDGVPTEPVPDEGFAFNPGLIFGGPALG